MNTFGRKFRVSIFGESHGELIGGVLDGVPAGLELSEQDFEADILRRKSGAKEYQYAFFGLQPFRSNASSGTCGPYCSTQMG